MTCEHLNKLEKELISKQIEVTFRGQAWSENCREWVYFDCLFINLEKIIRRLELDNTNVKIHSHFGTHDGQEYGIICSACNDGIMGHHPDSVRTNNRKVTKYA